MKKKGKGFLFFFSFYFSRRANERAHKRDLYELSTLFTTTEFRFAPIHLSLYSFRYILRRFLLWLLFIFCSVLFFFFSFPVCFVFHIETDDIWHDTWTWSMCLCLEYYDIFISFLFFSLFFFVIPFHILLERREFEKERNNKTKLLLRVGCWYFFPFILVRFSFSSSLVASRSFSSR